MDIYISQKISLYKGNFEGKFKFNLHAKSIAFWGWKFKSNILIFLLFFAEFVKATAFYTLLLLFQRVDMFELKFLHQMHQIKEICVNTIWQFFHITRMRKIILLFIAFLFIIIVSAEFVEAKKIEQSFAEPLWFLHAFAEFRPQIQKYVDTTFCIANLIVLWKVR